MLSKPVIVLDLDLTLIDDSFKPYPQMLNFLKKMFNNFAHIVIWTAGNNVHLEKFLESLPPTMAKKFDYKIHDLINSTKNSAFVRNFYKNQNKNPFILIDDNKKILNTGGYDIVINVSNYQNSNRFNVKKNYINYNGLYNDLMKKIKLWEGGGGGGSSSSKKKLIIAAKEKEEDDIASDNEDEEDDDED